MWESQFTMAGSCQGYLLVGEMLNHNDYYPEAYSQNVVHSFLTISANTTRVCSNLPESDTHYLGTEIPAVVQQAAAESGNYFGSEQAPIGGNYFFRYQALYDLSGTLVGYIGVGIEEEAYTSMLNVNRLIMLSVMLCLLPFIVLLSGVVSSRIARPITVGSAMAKRSPGVILQFWTSRPFRISLKVSRRNCCSPCRPWRRR